MLAIDNGRVGLNELKLKNHRIGDTNRKSEEGERKA
jgi:hypothetical protein